MALSPATFYDDNGVVRLQGQLDSSGGSQPYLSFPFSFDTPGLVDPNNQGVVAATFAEGDLVSFAAIQETTWDGGDNQIQCYLGADGDDTTGPLVGVYIASSGAANAGVEFLVQNTFPPSGAGDRTRVSRRFIVGPTRRSLIIAVYSDNTPPTMGSGLIVVQVTPAT